MGLHTVLLLSVFVCFRLVKLVNVLKVSFHIPLSSRVLDSNNFGVSFQLWFVCFAEGIATTDSEEKNCTHNKWGCRRHAAREGQSCTIQSITELLKKSISYIYIVLQIRTIYVKRVISAVILFWWHALTWTSALATRTENFWSRDQYDAASDV